MKLTHQGKLILDATVAEQAIRYPTDLSLLNEAREFSEQIIDRLYAKSALIRYLLFDACFRLSGIVRVENAAPT